MYYTIKDNVMYQSKDSNALKDYLTEIKVLPSDYEVGKYKIENNELVLNSNFEQEQLQKENERIAKLKLTKREVFLALYKDKGITPEQIKANITSPENLIEFEYATEYYRGNPLIDVIGSALGYIKEQLDYLFEYKTFENLKGGDGNVNA